jgi:hypothetical protein
MYYCSFDDFGERFCDWLVGHQQVSDELVHSFTNAAERIASRQFGHHLP